MKKRILQSLTILAVNIVLGGLALLSFFLFLFRGDPILVAVPAILALPGIILQPWIIAFVFLSGRLFLVPFLTTAVSVPVFLLLDRKGKLERALLARIKNRRAIVVSGTIIVSLILVAFARYVDFPSINKGIPRTLQYWTKDISLAPSRARYYCLESCVDSQWLWQARLPEKDVDVLASELRMHPIEPDQISDHYWRMPPYWWGPVASDGVRAFASPHFSMEGRGSDGWHALATWNAEDEMIHM